MVTVTPTRLGRGSLSAGPAIRRLRARVNRVLPRSLLGRSLLIIVTPLILLQVVSTWVFYDSHWETVTRKPCSARYRRSNSRKRRSSSTTRMCGSSPAAVASVVAGTMQKV